MRFRTAPAKVQGVNPSLPTTAAVLQRLRAKPPLVHCLTNHVVKGFTANALLALGAAPAMVEHPEEAEEFAAMASALLVNVGTIEETQMRAMEKAIPAAVAAGRPWVLDPVAVGPLGVRTRFAQGLLAHRPTLIRGNASEILALAGQSGRGRGVDSGDPTEAALSAAQQLAAQTGGAVLVSGPIDLITDGRNLVRCHNGHPLLTRVTGVGCAQGAIAAACLAVAQSPLEGAVAAALFVALAGDLAADLAQHPGSFQIAWLDALSRLDEELITTRGRLS